MDSYQRCTRCIMDNKSDKTIFFDENGYCNYCTAALQKIGTTVYFPSEDGQKKLDEMLSMLKKAGKGKKYDCMMGLSGGLDSSYLLYLGYKWGLRIMAVHIDDGFDTDISMENLRKLCKATNVDLKITTPDAIQYNGLIKAYMRAGVPNLAVPQDNIALAFLYVEAQKNSINYFLSGDNFALESILQQGNTYNAMDVRNTKDIHKKYGDKPIDKLKFISSYRKYIYAKVLGFQTLRPLNLVDYNRNRAFKELKDFCNFEYYGRKHLENILTAFLQLYWLPKKFGVDKRTSHLSSMIVSGQMTRDEALAELAEPMYDEDMMQSYIAIIKKSFGLSDEEFSAIMEAPPKQHTDYKTDKLAIQLRKIIK